MKFLILTLIFPFFTSAVVTEEDPLVTLKEEKAKTSIERRKKKVAFINISNDLVNAHDNVVFTFNTLITIAEQISKTATAASQSFASEDSITIALKDLSTATKELSKVASQEHRNYALLNAAHPIYSRLQALPEEKVLVFDAIIRWEEFPRGIKSDLSTLQELINMMLQHNDARIEKLLAPIYTALDNVATAISTKSSYDNQNQEEAIRSLRKAGDKLIPAYGEALEAKKSLNIASDTYMNCQKSFRGKSLL